MSELEMNREEANAWLEGHGFGPRFMTVYTLKHSPKDTMRLDWVFSMLWMSQDGQALMLFEPGMEPQLSHPEGVQEVLARLREHQSPDESK